MKYGYLVYALQGFGAKPYSRVSDEIRVYGAQLMRTQYSLPDGTTYYNSDYIYVGFVSELPQDPCKAPRDVICIADIPPPSGYNSHPDINLILCDANSDLMLLLNCVSFHLADDVRTTKNDLLFANMDNDQITLSSLLDVAYKHLHNPLIFTTASFKIIGVRGQFFSSEVLDAIDAGRIQEDLMQKFRSRNTYDLYKAQEYIIVINRGEWIVLPVKIRCFLIGWLLICNEESMFFNSDYRFAENLAQKLAVVMERQMERYDDFAMMQSALFIELLNKDQYPEKLLREHLNYLKWPYGEQLALFYIKIPKNLSDPDLTKLSRRLSDGLEGSRSLIYGNELLMLVPFPAYKQEEIYITLDRRCRESSVLALLSDSFDDYLQMQNYYMQVRRAYKLAKEIALPNGLHNYSELVPFVTAQALHSTNTLKDFIPGDLVKLIRYDMDHKSDLLSTLEAYIRYGGLTQDAIDSLSVSKSTAFYRLNKIRELCPLDIDNGVIRSRILVALCAYRMYGQVDM